MACVQRGMVVDEDHAFCSDVDVKIQEQKELGFEWEKAEGSHFLMRKTKLVPQKIKIQNKPQTTAKN